MMSSVNFNLHVSHLNDIEIPDNSVELLANDGKITANRLFLRLASPAVHSKLLENPDLKMIDLKNHKKSTIDCILNGIYTGQPTTFHDEVEKEEIYSLAKELDIGISLPLVVLYPPTGESKNIKVDAPAVPEEEEPKNAKNEDPGLIPLKDGRFGCGICFKPFSKLSRAERHYQYIHLAKEKDISCRAQGCDKKFANVDYMKEHMRTKHGISGALIPSTSATKSSTKSTKPYKKGTKKTPSARVIKKEKHLKQEPI